MERKTNPISVAEIKFASSDAQTFSGYASVFNGIDSYGDRILPGAFKSALRTLRKSPPKMFLNHASWELPVGKWTALDEDEKGLFVEGEFTPNITRAQEARAALQHGSLDGLSIGFRMSPKGYSIEEDEDGREVRVIKRIDELLEISIVTFPADSAARVDLSSVKGAMDHLCTIRDVEGFLREQGAFSKAAAEALLSRVKELVRGELAKEPESELRSEEELMSWVVESIALNTAALGDLRAALAR